MLQRVGRRRYCCRFPESGLLGPNVRYSGNPDPVGDVAMAEESEKRRVFAENIGASLVVRLRAKMLDDKDLNQLTELVEPAGPSSGISVIVLDMSRVQILSSLALGILVALTEKCQKQKQQLKLAEVVPPVLDVIKLTHLDRVLHLSDTVDVAIDSRPDSPAIPRHSHLSRGPCLHGPQSFYCSQETITIVSRPINPLGGRKT